MSTYIEEIDIHYVYILRIHIDRDSDYIYYTIYTHIASKLCETVSKVLKSSGAEEYK